ncbi:structural constituent of ribosome [Spatholobus suberectus]|nr:structural constituent of ribosome [Spatholobus suberectus]
MVYFHSSISLCNNSSVDQPMANSLDFGSKSRHRKTPNSPQAPPCRRSRSAVADVMIFAAVIAAFGVLLFPYAQIVVTESVKFGVVIVNLVREEVSVAPWVYMFIGVSVTFAALTTWVLVACTTRKCGNPNCKGLRKAAEFDIQLETEDCVRNSPSLGKDGGVKKGLFKLPCDHHRELEAELKKMAPPNGRAVLVLRARCGCSVGRLEVPGPKKNRKIKK